MKNRNKIQFMLDQNRQVITSKMLREQKIPSWFLTDMVRKNELVRLERGIYSTSEGLFDEFQVFQNRYGRCVFSFQTALYLHGLCDETPAGFDVTVYKGYNATKIKAPFSIYVHYIQKGLHELGLTQIESPFGQKVTAYDMERCICDLLKHRRTIEPETFAKVLKNYSQSEKRNPQKLREYAKIMKLDKKVEDVIGVLGI